MEFDGRIAFALLWFGVGFIIATVDSLVQVAEFGGTSFWRTLAAVPLWPLALCSWFIEGRK